MDFALSEEQEAIFATARDFGAAEIAPHARDWERAGTIPRALWPKLAELGFGGLYVSEASGGAGLGRLRRRSSSRRWRRAAPRRRPICRSTTWSPG